MIRMTPNSKYSVEPISVERMRITASGTIMFGAEPSRYIFDTEDMASLFKKYLEMSDDRVVMMATITKLLVDNFILNYKLMHGK